ncbi:MAG TPA: hypothetical protein VH477_16490 [Bryobacteraceae bacterium]|jgi:hypothetical protein
MNVAQHASNILEAWHNSSKLGAALESASGFKMNRPVSNLESERGEMLESIVDHLRQLASRNELPEPGRRNGALTLLSHLSSGAGVQEISDRTFSNNFSTKDYSSAKKASK